MGSDHDEKQLLLSHFISDQIFLPVEPEFVYPIPGQIAFLILASVRIGNDPVHFILDGKLKRRRLFLHVSPEHWREYLFHDEVSDNISDHENQQRA